MKKKKIRPLGDILLDIEPYLFEMYYHGLQTSDYYGLFNSWKDAHCRQMDEEYWDSSRAVFFYGHEDDLLTLADKIKKNRAKLEQNKLKKGKNGQI